MRRQAVEAVYMFIGGIVNDITRPKNEDDDIGKALSALPVWARILVLLGAPAAIAVFLTYFLSQNVQSQLTAITSQHTTLSIEHQNVKTDLALHQASTTASIDRMGFFLRAICIRVSTTESQRAECQQ